jgi:hypothetical protein
MKYDRGHRWPMHHALRVRVRVSVSVRVRVRVRVGVRVRIRIRVSVRVRVSVSVRVRVRVVELYCPSLRPSGDDCDCVHEDGTSVQSIGMPFIRDRLGIVWFEGGV